MKKSPQGDYRSDNKINKYIKYLATSIAFFLATSQQPLAQPVKNWDESGSMKALHYNNVSKDEVMHYLAKDVIQKYWSEKWLELIVYYMVQQINEIRRDSGLQELVVDQNLTKTAQQYAQYLADNKHYSHIDLQGKDACYRVNRVWYKWRCLWENLSRSNTAWWAIGSIDFKQWRMRSEGHRKNLLHPSANSVWIGYTHISRPGAKPSYPSEDDNYFVLIVWRN